MLAEKKEELVKVASEDGTTIACWVSGHGPPLVLVHGSFADHTRWRPVLSELAGHFTIYAVDRRGRGASGDSKEYSVEREFQDMASVVDSIPEPVNLLGHSYGALCALEASLRTWNIRRLILYEPPTIGGGMPIPKGLVAEVQHYIDVGEPEKAVLKFMSEGLRMPQEQIEKARSLPSWPSRIAAVRTVPREFDAVDRYRFSPGRFGGLGFPTLLLMGSESPQPLKDAVESAHMAIPKSRVVVMAGEGHAAGSLPGPGAELFASEVIRFLEQ